MPPCIQSGTLQDVPKDMKTLDIISQEGERIGNIKLNQKLFDGSVNQPLVHETALMYQTNARAGSANTKARAEVRGGGRKPWRQKGTGRARAGSIRSPLWRGGGITFGPKPKDYYYRLPAKALKQALRSALNDKINENKIIILDKIELASHKTKGFADILKKLKLDFDKGRLLLVVDSMNEKLKKASNNLKKVAVLRGCDVNAYRVILAEKILIERSAFTNLEKRLTQ